MEQCIPILKDYDNQSRLMQLVKLSPKDEGEKKTFHNIISLKIISNKPNLNIGSNRKNEHSQKTVERKMK